jgi:hypothetical protein
MTLQSELVDSLTVSQRNVLRLWSFTPPAVSTPCAVALGLPKPVEIGNAPNATNGPLTHLWHSGSLLSDSQSHPA